MIVVIFVEETKSDMKKLLEVLYDKHELVKIYLLDCLLQVDVHSSHT